jgi:cation:H+ antiporter
MASSAHPSAGRAARAVTLTPVSLMTLVLLFVGGIAALIAGANLLVRGASSLAAAFGIPPLVIGLTVVAFGTSSPELAVSVQSAWSGQTDIAVGNAVGSNIFNVLFILGLSALVAPLVVAEQLVRKEVPVMIGASALLLLLATGGVISRAEGAVLFGGVVVYTVYLIVQARRQGRSDSEDYAREYGDAAVRRGRHRVVQIAFVLAGLALLVLGSTWLVDAAVQTARLLGLSELIIGLTIVAAGTSLPEVAASVIATMRGERDIAVGNVVGSNIFNVLAVLGLSALVSPSGLEVAPALVRFDIPVMTVVAVACLPIFLTGYRIARWEGALFLAYYVCYTAYLILAATRHDALPAFSAAMLFFALPLTAVTLLVVVVRHVRAAR